MMILRILSLLCLLLIPLVETLAQSTDYREEFENLSSWQELHFDKIKAYSNYSIVQESTGALLRLESSQSASGLVSSKTFTLTEKTCLSWRWKADRIMPGLDGTKKKDDDYALRLYLMFEDASPDESFGERMSYTIAQALHSKPIPRSSLMYVWANQRYKIFSFESPYTDRVQVIPLDAGQSALGVWRDHTRSPYQDYQNAFHKRAPLKFRLALMNDSDNSQKSALSYIDWISIAENCRNPDSESSP